MFHTWTGDKSIPAGIVNLFRGQSVFLTSSGPSLAKMDLSLLRKPGIMTFGVNNSPKIFRPNLWLSVDLPSRFLESVWRDPRIMKFVNGRGKHDKPIARVIKKDNWEYSAMQIKHCPNIYYWEGNTHFQPKQWLTEDTINWGNSKDFGGGRTCMLATLRIAYMLGFRRVYLCGVDFRMTEDYAYAFKEQRSKQAVKNNNCTYSRTISYFTQLAPEFKKAGFEIYQSTPDSDLTMFPFRKLEDAVADTLSDFPDPEKEETFGKYTPDTIDKIDPVTKQHIIQGEACAASEDVKDD